MKKIDIEAEEKKRQLKLLEEQENEKLVKEKQLQLQNLPLDKEDDVQEKKEEQKFGIKDAEPERTTIIAF